MSLTRDAVKPIKKPIGEQRFTRGGNWTLAQLSGARAMLLIGLLAILAYSNSLGGDFVFDDTDQIAENQNIRSWDNLAKSFTTHVWAFREGAGSPAARSDLPPPLPYYRPLFTVMLTVEYHLFGLWPQGWHLVSLLLHILCAVGVFYVILAMSGRSLVALLASAVFAVHPVHAESVAWVSGMTDPLFGVFFLASLYLYLKQRGSGSPRARNSARVLALSLVLFALAAFAKETALSLILLIFGYEFIANSGSVISRLKISFKRSAPYVAVALLYLVPRYLVLGELMWRNPQAPERPLAYTLLTLPLVICTYAGHLSWPAGLSIAYNTHFVTTMRLGEFLLPAALLSATAIALFLYRRKVSREVWHALLLIAVPLLPVLNLGQVSRDEYLVFDHYLYLSVAGLGYLIGLAIVKLGAFDSSGAPSRIFGLRRPVVAVALFVAIAVVLTIAATRENSHWSDSYSLWSNAARVRPSYWAAHYNIGLALLDSKRFNEARDELARAALLKSDAPEVYDSLGRAYEGAGDTAAAISSFERALALDPGMFESLNNLGTVYFKRSDFPAAQKYFAAALVINPQASTALFNLGLCYSRRGNSVDAIRQFERVRDLGLADDEVYYELGLAYEQVGRLKDAVAALERAREITRSQDLAGRVLERLNGIQSKF
jgi:tetratricopeptide (TPR) repeat protein